MKKMNKVLAVAFLLMSPGLLSAHPGHGHTGDWMNTLWHYMATYYVFIIPIAAIMLVLFNMKSIKRIVQKIKA